jgi:hypothetical protein
MKHLSSIEDQNFRREFEARKFPPAEFNHRAHIRLAYVYLSAYDTDARRGKCSASLRRTQWRPFRNEGYNDELQPNQGARSRANDYVKGGPFSEL